MSRAASLTRNALPAASPHRGRPFGTRARTSRGPSDSTIDDATGGECAMPAHADTLPPFAARPLGLRRTGSAAGAFGRAPRTLLAWYLGLIPHWMGADPSVRCALLLRTHEWIVDRVLDPDVSLAAAAADLRPDGALSRTLSALVPPEEMKHWKHFIHLVVANLRHALLLPVTRRNEAWVRWLFLIPYSIRYAPEAAPVPMTSAPSPMSSRGRPCSEA